MTQSNAAAKMYPHSDKRGRRSEVSPDVNLTALAEEVGVGPDYLSKLFRGIGHPSVPLAQKLAQAMSIPMDQLVRQLDDAREKRAQALRVKKSKAKDKGKGKRAG